MRINIFIGILFFAVGCTKESIDLLQIQNGKILSFSELSQQRLQYLPNWVSLKVVGSNQEAVSRFFSILFSEDKAAWIVNSLGDAQGIFHVSFSKQCVPSKVMVFSKGFEPALVPVSCSQNEKEKVVVLTLAKPKSAKQKISPWLQSALQENLGDKKTFPVMVLLKSLDRKGRNQLVERTLREFKIANLENLNNLVFQSPSAFSLEMSRNFPALSLRLIQLEFLMAYWQADTLFQSSSESFSRVASYLFDKKFSERMKTLKVAVAGSSSVPARQLASLEIPNLLRLRTEPASVLQMQKKWLTEENTKAEETSLSDSGELAAFAFKELYQAFLSPDGEEIQRMWTSFVHSGEWVGFMKGQKGEAIFDKLVPFLNNLQLFLRSEKAPLCLSELNEVFSAKDSVSAIRKLYVNRNESFPSLTDYSQVIAHPKQLLFFEFLKEQTSPQKNVLFQQDYEAFPAFRGSFDKKTIEALTASSVVLKIYPQFE